MACWVNLCELLVLYFLSILCVFIFWVPSTRYLSNCCDVSSLALLRKKVLFFTITITARMYEPFVPGNLESWCLVLSLSLMMGDYVLCKTHADSGRDFVLQCCPVPNRENKGEGRSMSGGSISLCMGGHYWGLGTSHPM